MGVQLDKKYANNLKGQFTFRMHGSIYRRMGSLLPNTNEVPKFLQLFTDNELENRIKNLLFNCLNCNKKCTNLIHMSKHLNNWPNI